MDFLLKVKALLTQENIELLLAIIGVVSIIATRTPNKVDNKIVNVLLKAINYVGMNFGKAKNK